MEDTQDLVRRLNALLESAYNTGKIYQVAAQLSAKPTLQKLLREESWQRYGLAVQIENQIKQIDNNYKLGTGLRADLVISQFQLSHLLNKDIQKALLKKCHQQDEKLLKAYKKSLRIVNLPNELESALKKQQKHLLQTYTFIDDLIQV